VETGAAGGAPRSPGRRRLLAAAALAAVAAGAWRGFSLTLTRLRYGLARRVLFLTDLHIHHRQPTWLHVLLEETRPDLVLLGGDLWDELSPRPPAPALQVVEELTSWAPVAAVLGNHEHWTARRGGPGLEEAARLLEARGAVLLRDEAAWVGGLRVCGVDWRDRVDEYPAALNQLPLGRCSIVLAHSPDVFHYASTGARLLYLAGHTHGGQVCLPGARSIRTNSVYGYTWGRYQRGKAVLYVSRGLGEMIPPRICCPREAVVID
jgi:predicted MPP superfamily phosphohydrolase